MEDKFSLKKTVSLTLGLSFLVMSYTGIMLFFTPKGKIAFWTDWTLLGLSKTQYTDLHITSMFLFLTAGVWHIYYNWKPLVSYLKTHAHRLNPLKKEFLAAVLLNLFFVGATMFHLPPMQSIVNLNTAIKDYWERQVGAPPFGHAEEATVALLAPQNGIDTPTALKRLRDAGFRAKNGQQTLEQIAVENGVSAQKVYDTMLPRAQAQQSVAPLSGMGRRSIGSLAEAGHIDLEKALAYLEEQGVIATPQTTMRDAAGQLGTTPYTLFETLQALP
ncbi:DUF4405 domain-containing protein [Sulfurimonas diazotrophicus]|uniref:DUF4405 domain-containing protein n=1 Tax=Sulfurimonas diazotrophicus TaxID=3131939 RepID=A0ABZ3HBS5_9BACT